MSYKEEIVESLTQRKKILESTIKRAEMDLNQSIKGHIEVCNIRNHYRYYYKAPKGENDGKREYTRDIAYAKQIAQQDYAKEIIYKGTKELKQINALLNIYQNTVVDELYPKLHPGRQLLVEPILIDDEKFAEIWIVKAEKQKQEIFQKYPNTFQIQNPIQTENQEIVRSKSEKIIADKLKLLGIPYIYEKPLQLGKIVKYPDFTALNKRTRKEYYGCCNNC